MNEFEYIEFNQVGFLAFCVDMVFIFNTGIYFKGGIIKNRLKIASSYLKSNFLLDLFGIIPLIHFYFLILIENKIYKYLVYSLIMFKLFHLYDIF